MTKAMTESAMIMTLRLFHLSTKVPTNGPRSTCGSIAIIEANDNTEADFDSLVSHQTKAN